MAQNVFMTSMYFFIPLISLREEYRAAWKYGKEDVDPPELIRYSEAKYSYCKLEKLNQYFQFDYKNKGNKIHREVELKVWLIKFSSALNKDGRFYLVVSAGVDKAFYDSTSKTPFHTDDICKKQDVIQLKKAFYEKGDKGFYYEHDSTRHYFHQWLNKKILDITGRNLKPKIRSK